MSNFIDFWRRWRLFGALLVCGSAVYYYLMPFPLGGGGADDERFNDNVRILVRRRNAACQRLWPRWEYTERPLQQQQQHCAAMECSALRRGLPFVRLVLLNASVDFVLLTDSIASGRAHHSIHLSTPCDANPLSTHLSAYLPSDSLIQRNLLPAIASNDSNSGSALVPCTDSSSTLFLYHAPEAHIYFRLLALLSLFTAALDEGIAPTEARAVRLPEHPRDHFRLDGAERALFPHFRPARKVAGFCRSARVVLVPSAYHTRPFRCKLDSALRENCTRNGCDSTLQQFRRYTLERCGALGTLTNERHVVLVSRRPYKRYQEDRRERFERMLENEEALSERLTQRVGLTVRLVQFEKMEFCEQVREARRARFLIGVHGAGLVHLLWLGEHALALELMPEFERGNPTFDMLASLSGRRFEKILVESVRVGSMRRFLRAPLDRIEKRLLDDL